jgi:hypothetical protein
MKDGDGLAAVPWCTASDDEEAYGISTLSTTWITPFFW